MLAGQMWPSLIMNKDSIRGSQYPSAASVSNDNSVCELLVNWKDQESCIMWNRYRSLKDVGLATMVLILLCRLSNRGPIARIALCPLRPGLGLGTCWAITPGLWTKKEVELVKMDVSMI
jgi:hypothetical protein